MLWLYLCIVVALFWSISAFIDNYVTDVVFKKKKPQTVKIFDGISYLAIAAAILLTIGVKELSIPSIGYLLLSGVLASVSTIPYYLALRDEESTTAVIFYQLSPVLYFLAEWLIFNEPITGIQLIGLIIILIAPVVVVFSRKRQKSRRMEFSAALLLLIFVLIGTISGLITTHIGEKADFVSVFFWFLLGRGISDILLYAIHKDWQKRMKYIWRHDRFKFLFALTVNQTICVATEFISRYALIIGIASLVSATYNVLELIFTFVLGIALSIIWPKFGREKLKRHIIIAHLIATILASIGIILIQ